jgi:hypothetical protein
MRKISIIIGIIIILVLFIIICIAEIITASGLSCGTFVLDYCKDNYLKKIKNENNISDIMNDIEDITNNQPYIYRQSMVLGLFQSIIVTNFLYIGLPNIKIEHFFYIFFVMYVTCSLGYAFINFHYYIQKEEMIKHGLNRVNEILKKNEMIVKKY